MDNLTRPANAVLRLTIACLLFCTGAFAATKYLQSNQSTSSDTWYTAASGGSTTADPADGDAVVLNGCVLTLDTALFPASGTLSSITDGGKTGYLAVPLNTTGNCAITANTVTGGSNTTGFIQVTGATSNTLTVTVNLANSAVCPCVLYHNSTGTVSIIGNLSGGTASSKYGANVVSTGTLNVTGNVSAGSGASSAGIYTNTACTVHVSGNVTGGNGIRAYGIWCDTSGTATVTINGNVTGGVATGAMGVFNQVAGITLTGCNLADGTGGVAWGGKPPTWTNNGSNYIQKTITEGTVKFGREPSASNLLYGIVCGDVTGTYQGPSASNVRKDIPVGTTAGTCYVPNPVDVLYGVNVDATTGTYHGPLASNVRKDIPVGTTAGTCYVPNPVDVLYGVNVDATTGTYHGPLASNVRKDIAVGSTVGTCYVPSPADTRKGVPVDNTVGTYLAPAGTRNPYVGGR